MDGPTYASASPKDFVGLVLCHSLSHCTTSTCWGQPTDCKECGPTWLNMNQLQSTVHHKMTVQGTCCLEISALAASGNKSVSQITQRDPPWPFSQVAAGRCHMAQVSGNQPTRVTQAAGASWSGITCLRDFITSFLKPQNKRTGKCDHICTDGYIWLLVTSTKEWKHFLCKYQLKISEEQVSPNHARRPLDKLRYL